MGSKVGAIDIGSNAIRYAIAKDDGEKGYEVIQTQREAISLGRSVFVNKERVISESVFQRAIKALQEFRQNFIKNNVSLYRIVGTSALRDASNQNQFLTAARETGLNVEPISGEEEARLIHKAVLHSVNLEDKNAALLDIGGGSVECTVMSHGEPIFSISERIGTIRLLRSLAEQKITVEKFSERISKVVRGLAEKVESAINSLKLDMLVGTGGNVEELGSLRVKLIPGKKKTNKIRLKELHLIIDILEPLTPAERQEKFGFREDRADVILPAAIILREVMERTRVEKVIIPRVGLRDGVLLELLEQERIGKR